MPGVGKEYEPSIDSLKGIAIEVTQINPIHWDHGLEHSAGENVFWKYFPKEALPVPDEDKFKLIFKEKIQWTFDELEPYFDQTKFESLLLKYTTRHKDDNNYIWYEGKQVIN